MSEEPRVFFASSDEPRMLSKANDFKTVKSAACMHACVRACASVTELACSSASERYLWCEVLTVHRALCRLEIAQNGPVVAIIPCSTDLLRFRAHSGSLATPAPRHLRMSNTQPCPRACAPRRRRQRSMPASKAANNSDTRAQLRRRRVRRRRGPLRGIRVYDVLEGSLRTVLDDGRIDVDTPDGCLGDGVALSAWR